MKNDYQAVSNKSIRSFTQDLQQAFIDWMKKLPFIKNADRNRTGQKDPEEESAHVASRPIAIIDTVAGTSPADKGTPQ